MKFRVIVFFLCAAAFLTLGTQQARADWVAEQIFPKGNAKSERVFKVKIKQIEDKKECEITVSPNAKVKAAPLKAAAEGTVYVNPEGYRQRGVRSTEKTVPAEGYEEVKAKETRKKNAVTYTFRVSADQLPKLRFEFRESGALGGEIYWFNLKEFVEAKK